MPMINFVIDLGAHEDRVKEYLIELEGQFDQEPDMFDVDGRMFKRLTYPNGGKAEYGIDNNRFYFALEAGELAKLIANGNTPPPDYYQQMVDEMPVERPVFWGSVNLIEVFSSLSDLNRIDPTMEKFRFYDIRSAKIVFGFDQTSSVSRMVLDAPEGLTGFWGTFDNPSIDIPQLAGVSDSVDSLSAIQLNLKHLWDLFAPEMGQDDDRDALRQMTAEFAVDLEKDILDNVGQLAYSYQQLSLLNPAAGVVASIEIKDVNRVNAVLEKLLERVEDYFLDDFILEKKDNSQGMLYELIPLDPTMQMVFPGVAFQASDNELLIALDAKAINTHHRRLRRSGGKLTDLPDIAALFDSQLNGSLGQPSGVFYLNMSNMIESVYAVIPLIFAFDGGMNPNVDLDLLPPVEVLTDGVGPTSIGLYRIESGFHIYERSTLPGVLATSPLFVATLLPAVQQVRAAARRAQSQNNIRQLILASLNHESAFRSLPPAAKVDQDGNPLLSWRVQLLPFLEENELYDQFKLDEPWDSPHNFALIEKMPDVFAHPDAKLEPGKTIYLGVAGKQGLFAPATFKEGKQAGRSFQTIIDGTSNSVMIVEAAADKAVYWTQPEDLNIDQEADWQSWLLVRPGNMVVLGMCDGSIQSIPLPSNELLKSLFTVDGGEVIDWNSLLGIDGFNLDFDFESSVGERAISKQL